MTRKRLSRGLQGKPGSLISWEGYEHNGGEVDQKYLDDSADTSVRLKQALRETPDSVFRTTGLILRMARNLHEGFHELFPPMEKPIEIHKEQQVRLGKFRQGR